MKSWNGTHQSDFFQKQSNRYRFSGARPGRQVDCSTRKGKYRYLTGSGGARRLPDDVTFVLVGHEGVNLNDNLKQQIPSQCSGPSFQFLGAMDKLKFKQTRADL